MFLSYLVFSTAPCAGDPDYAGGDVFMEAGRGWFTDPEVCIQTLLSQDCVVVALCEALGRSSSSPSDDEAELVYCLKTSYKRKGCSVEGEVSRSPSVERLVVATSSVANEVKLEASTLPLVESGTVSVVKGTTSFKRCASTPLAVARKAKLGRKEVSLSPIGSLDGDVSPSPIGSLDGGVSPSPIGSLDGGLPLGVLTFMGTCPVMFL